MCDCVTAILAPCSDRGRLLALSAQLDAMERVEGGIGPILRELVERAVDGMDGMFGGERGRLRHLLAADWRRNIVRNLAWTRLAVAKERACRAAGFLDDSETENDGNLKRARDDVAAASTAVTACRAPNGAEVSRLSARYGAVRPYAGLNERNQRIRLLRELLELRLRTACGEALPDGVLSGLEDRIVSIGDSSSVTGPGTMEDGHAYC